MAQRYIKIEILASDKQSALIALKEQYEDVKYQIELLNEWKGRSTEKDMENYTPMGFSMDNSISEPTEVPYPQTLGDYQEMYNLKE